MWAPLQDEAESASSKQQFFILFAVASRMKSHSVTVPDLPPEEAERLSELRDRLKWKMVDLKVKIGDTVNVQQELASFGVYYIKTTEEVRVWTDRIKSAHNGTVKRVSINESSRIRPGYDRTLYFHLICISHSIWIRIPFPFPFHLALSLYPCTMLVAVD